MSWPIFTDTFTINFMQLQFIYVFNKLMNRIDTMCHSYRLYF